MSVSKRFPIGSYYTSNAIQIALLSECVYRRDSEKKTKMLNIEVVSTRNKLVETVISSVFAHARYDLREFNAKVDEINMCFTKKVNTPARLVKEPETCVALPVDASDATGTPLVLESENEANACLLTTS